MGAGSKHSAESFSFAIVASFAVCATLLADFEPVFAFAGRGVLTVDRVGLTTFRVGLTTD